MVDGTFIGINNLKRKIPVIYGIDYKSHDIPTFKLSKSENYLACREFFVSCNLAGYPLSMLVCDDNRNIHEACHCIYRNCHHQLCHNHFKQNIKQFLGFSSHNKTHLKFIREIENLLGHKLSRDDFNARAAKIIKYYSFEPKYMQVMLNIAHHQDELLAFHHHKGTPITNNLIESYNKHLKSRLKSICYFQDTKHARLWLNAYFLHRRTKIFTDCKGKFRNLNGKTSLSLTKKSDIELPMFFK